MGRGVRGVARRRRLDAARLPPTSNGWRSPPTSPATTTRRATPGRVRIGSTCATTMALAAVRCAFWLGCVLILRGQLAPAHGWFARTQHLLDQAHVDPVETGYLDLAAGLETLFSGDPVAARPRLEAAAAPGSRHGEPDLAALGRLGCGQSLIMIGRSPTGVAMLDEAMVAVSAGEVSPVATGSDLLRGDRDLPGSVRPSPGAGVDRSARRLVRRAARPRPVPRAVPCPPRRS